MADACSVVTNQFYTNVRCQGLRLQAAQAFEQQQTGNAISTVKHRTCSVRGLTCKHSALEVVCCWRSGRPHFTTYNTKVLPRGAWAGRTRLKPCSGLRTHRILLCHGTQVSALSLTARLHRWALRSCLKLPAVPQR